MGSDTLITFLLFLCVNIAIYVALFRWASQINEIVKNLESINTKLDALTEVVIKRQEQDAFIRNHDNSRQNNVH